METVVYGLLMALIVAGTLLNVAYIGKPRQAITPATACAIVVLNGLWALAVTYLWVS